MHEVFMHIILHPNKSATKTTDNLFSETIKILLVLPLEGMQTNIYINNTHIFISISIHTYQKPRHRQNKSAIYQVCSEIVDVISLHYRRWLF